MEPVQDEIEKQNQVASDAEGTGYAAIGGKIVGWTSNLLATSVVVIVALAVGTQLVSSFRPVEDSNQANSELVAAWPELQSCALEFGDSPFQLQRDTVLGGFDQAMNILQAQCRAALESGAMAVGEIGERESALLAEVVNTNDARPIEESPGKWRIFQVSSSAEVNSGLPMVVGVRDDLREEDSPADSAGSNSSNGTRLAVWGLAMPRAPQKQANSSEASNWTSAKTETGNPKKTLYENMTAAAGLLQADQEVAWTTFVARAVPDTEGDRFKSSLIPGGCVRTLSIANPNGGSLIGFVGESVDQAKQFYNVSASANQWKVSLPWQQNDDNWSAHFKLPKESPYKGIQVQLHVNHNEKVRGMLMVQPK